MKRISTVDAPAAIGPYSRAIGPYSRVIAHPGLIFVSGQLPIDPSTGALIEIKCVAAE